MFVASEQDRDRKLRAVESAIVAARYYGCNETDVEEAVRRALTQATQILRASASTPAPTAAPTAAVESGALPEGSALARLHRIYGEDRRAA